MPISPSAGAGTPALLAFFVQTAGTNQATTSATQADVDATNAAVTFTTPQSGIVLVRATFECSVSAAFQNGRVGLRESTTDVKGPSDAAVGLASAATFQTVCVAFRVTGLTAGSAHTYKLAYSVTGGATFTILQIGSTSTSFPVTLEVWAAL